MLCQRRRQKLQWPGLEFEKSKCCSISWHPNKRQCGIWNIEYIFVKIMELCSVCDKDRIIRFFSRRQIIMQFQEKRQGKEITGANHYSVNIVQDCAIDECDGSRCSCVSNGISNDAMPATRSVFGGRKRAGTSKAPPRED